MKNASLSFITTPDKGAVIMGNWGLKTWGKSAYSKHGYIAQIAAGPSTPVLRVDKAILVMDRWSWDAVTYVCTEVGTSFSRRSFTYTYMIFSTPSP